MDKRITLYGAKKEKERAERILSTLDLENLSEGKARLKIQEKIDSETLKASILFDGNSVWSQKKIIRNLKQIIKKGTLYRDRETPLLTKYFYNFLHLCCGSIAHYSIHGWIYEYPTVEALRNFFRRNEFGKRVLDHIPVWKTDAIEIVKEIERLLGDGDPKRWIVDLESFAVAGDTEQDARRNALEYLAFRPKLLIENITLDED